MSKNNAVGFSVSRLREELFSDGGEFTVVLTPTSTTVIKPDIARLCLVLLLTTNDGQNVTFFDSATTNTTGATNIGFIPQGAVAGTIYNFNTPAYFGITVSGYAGAPQMTISYN